jgi:hypothetical protein
MTPTARIGSGAAGMNGQENGIENALVGAYLSRIGMSHDAASFATQTSPDQITYLTIDAARRVGIEIDILDVQPAPTTVTPAPLPVPLQSQAGAPAVVPPLGDVTYLSKHPGLKNETVEEQAASLLAHLFSSWNSGYMQGISSMYADNVFYYGKETSKADVVLDKKRFMDRWPVRSYTVRPGTTSIRCNGRDTQLDECVASGTVDWVAANQTRRATGVANFSYTLRPYPTGIVWDRNSNKKLDLRITAENSAVTERKAGD